MTDGEGGTLYVVSTPIGNLSDITVRALDTLRDVPLIAAEDTRLTRRLLARHGIETRLTSYHARSGPSRLAALLDHLRRGADLALVTDAGTPGVSDPGGELVMAWGAAGGRVVPIPGASAVLAALAATGVAGPRWVFEGFLPRSGRERRQRLTAIAADARGAVLYEAPTRLAATLGDLVEACGGERRAAVARELTKLHEQLVTGSLASLSAAVDEGAIPERGELVIVVGMMSGPAAAGVATTGASSAGATGTPGVDALAAARAQVEALVADGVARGEAARRVAAATGLPRRSLYGVARD